MQRRLPSALGRFALAFFFLFIASKPAQTHTLPVSFLQLVPDADYLHLELTFNPFELTFFHELDANHDGRIDASEWDAVQSKVTARLLECVRLNVDGKPIAAEVAAIIPDFDSHHATLRAHYPIDARERAVTLESDLDRLTSLSHFTQVTFGRGAAAQAARLDPQSVRVTFEPSDKGAGRPASAARNAPSGNASSVFSLLLAFAPITLLLASAAFMSRSRRRAARPSAPELDPRSSLVLSEALPQPVTSERTL